MVETLWMIIYTAGHIGGVAGPLPYGMDECIMRRDEMRGMQTETLERGTSDETGKPLTKKDIDGILSMTFECEFRAVKPQLGEKVEADAGN